MYPNMVMFLFLNEYKSARDIPKSRKQKAQNDIVSIVALPGASRNHPPIDSGASRSTLIRENNAVKTTLKDICFLLIMYFGKLSVKAI